MSSSVRTSSSWAGSLTTDGRRWIGERHRSVAGPGASPGRVTQRVSSNGRASAFQADDAGSSPVTRSMLPWCQRSTRGSYPLKRRFESFRKHHAPGVPIALGAPWATIPTAEDIGLDPIQSEFESPVAHHADLAQCRGSGFKSRQVPVQDRGSVPSEGDVA